jgi:hypothetical protein
MSFVLYRRGAREEPFEAALFVELLEFQTSCCREHPAEKEATDDLAPVAVLHSATLGSMESLCRNKKIAMRRRNLPTVGR